jgi:uncharacterized membrane protein YcgQ (UPF0703/DUF1980 family)
MHNIPELWTFVWSFCTWQNLVTVQRRNYYDIDYLFFYLLVLGLKLMKMCNKKQYIYFICTFMCMFYRSLFVLFLLAIIQVTIFFLLNSRHFFLQTKTSPPLPLQKSNGQISNIVLIFFPREVRDKNKESSIYAQHSWIVDAFFHFLFHAEAANKKQIVNIATRGTMS